jgi:hypothetical protein
MSLTKVTYSMIEGGLIYAKDYGAVGDGVADDTAAWQAAAAAAQDKTLLAEPNKTYKLTGTIALQENTILNLQGSTINFEINGAVKCLQANNFCTITNGKIKNFGTTLNIFGSFQCPIVMESKHNVIVSNMIIDSDWVQGAGIFALGESYDIIIENIEIPDNSQMNCPISAEWTGNTTLTNHPHNIVIRNVTCNTLRTDSAILYFSAAYNITVENVNALRCGIGITWYGGDYTNMYADPRIKHLIGTGLIVKNLTCPNVFATGIDCRGQSFNPNIVTPPTVAIDLKGRFESCDLWAQSNSQSLFSGAKLEYVFDIEIVSCKFRRFYTGVNSSTDCYNVYVSNCYFQSIYQNGIFCSFSSPSTGQPTGWLIDSNVFELCNTQESNSLGNAAVVIGTSKSICLSNNIFGDPNNAETTRYAVYVTDGALYPVLLNNFVINLNNSNTAYVIGSAATSYDINARGDGNACLPLNILNQPIISFFNAPIFSNLNGIRSGVASQNALPTTGTWNTGDKLYLRAPTSTILGYVCTTAGTGNTGAGGTAVWRDITA